MNTLAQPGEYVIYQKWSPDVNSISLSLYKSGKSRNSAILTSQECTANLGSYGQQKPSTVQSEVREVPEESSVQEQESTMFVKVP